MGTFQKRVLKLVLLALVVGVAAWPSLLESRVRRSGAVIPQGTDGHDFGRSPLRFVSVTGTRPAAGGEQHAAALHALVLLPDAPVEGTIESGTTTVSGYRASFTQRWAMRRGSGTETRQLDGSYDALRRSVTLAGRRFSLREGNLFFVRFRVGMAPEVIQLDTTVNAQTGDDGVPRALLAAFRSRLPDQAALLREPREPEPSCDE